MLWLVSGFVLLVYWLVGHLLARIMVFAVLVVITCWSVSLWQAGNPSFIPPDAVIGIVASWFIAGIPHHYRRRSNRRRWESGNDALRDLAADLQERNRLAGLGIRNSR
jgi:hypothetical protein